MEHHTTSPPPYSPTSTPLYPKPQSTDHDRKFPISSASEKTPLKLLIPSSPQSPHITFTADLERQAWAVRRSQPLAPQAPAELSTWQKVRWYYRERTFDTVIATCALFIAFVAAVALVFLVCLFLQATGRLGGGMGRWTE
jgi:hypothetical protein